MEENKIFTESDTKLKYIANSKWGFGDRLLEGSISTKILRSLPEWFMPKVTDIQEVTDLDTKKVDELIGPLLTYELQFTTPKKKSTAPKSSTLKKKKTMERQTLKVKLKKNQILKVKMKRTWLLLLKHPTF